MEGVREQFRPTGHDHPRCTFNNGGDIANMLEGIFKGAVRSGALFDLLQHGHRSRSTRGSNDFRFPRFSVSPSRRQFEQCPRRSLAQSV